MFLRSSTKGEAFALEPSRRGGGGKHEGFRGVENEQPSGFDLDRLLCEISSGPRLSATIYNMLLPLDSLPVPVPVSVPFPTLRERIRTLFSEPFRALRATCRVHTRPSCTYERVKLAKSFALFFVYTGVYARTPRWPYAHNSPLPSV